MDSFSDSAHLVGAFRLSDVLLSQNKSKPRNGKHNYCWMQYSSFDWTILDPSPAFRGHSMPCSVTRGLRLDARTHFFETDAAHVSRPAMVAE